MNETQEIFVIYKKMCLVSSVSKCIYSVNFAWNGKQQHGHKAKYIWSNDEKLGIECWLNVDICRSLHNILGTEICQQED
jgi:hypothetical protein